MNSVILWEDFVRRKTYPHLLGVDSKIWDRFIRFFPTYFEKVAYDIHLGEGVQTPPNLEPKYQEMARLLTQKRVDVIGMTNSNLTLIEVKTYAGTTAVGQLLTYRFLFDTQFPDLYISKLLLITDTLQPDMKDFCERNKITVMELGYTP